MKEKLEALEAALKEAHEHAVAVETELAHCPSLGALKSRIGNSLEMLKSLEREARTLEAPKKTETE